MNQDEIKKEWDAFIEYPEGSGKLYVTTTSALLFARCIADMAADKEREACAEECDALASCEGIAQKCATAIRARGNT